MAYVPITDEKVPSALKNFMGRALQDITGEEISGMDNGPSSDLLSCLSQKIARETDLDSSDVAQWIRTAVKEYWVTETMTR